MERSEGEILQLHLHLLHAEPVRKRGVDLEGLASGALLFECRHACDGLQIVETIGELDDQHPNVLSDRHDHLAHRGGLLLFLGVVMDPIELGDPIDDASELCRELPLKFLETDHRVLDGVVKQSGGDGDVVEALTGNDGGHRHRMADVRLARLAVLAAVRLLGHRERRLDHGRFGLRVVLGVLGEQRCDLGGGRPVGGTTPRQDSGDGRHQPPTSITVSIRASPSLARPSRNDSSSRNE